MAIVKQYHKETDTTYVYESDSYWDAEKKQSRSRRKLIGKLDPHTGEVIPTGKRGRKAATTPPPVEQPKRQYTDAQYEQCHAKLEEQQEIIQQLRQRVIELEQQNKLLQSAMQKAAITMEHARNMLTDIASK